MILEFRSYSSQNNDEAYVAAVRKMVRTFQRQERYPLIGEHLRLQCMGKKTHGRWDRVSQVIGVEHWHDRILVTIRDLEKCSMDIKDSKLIGR